MKSKDLQFFILASILLLFSKTVDAQDNKVIIGTWKFQCPYAPEGFNTGIIDIHKDSVFTTFSSVKYKFPSMWVKNEKDTLSYNVDINGEQVLFSLRIENNDTLYGKARNVMGEGPITLIRKRITDPNDQKQ
jgi:hypothetical protein